MKRPGITAKKPDHSTPRQHQDMQYSLRSLLLAFVLVALALAVCGWAGAIVGPIVLALVAFGRAGNNRKWRLVVATTAILFIGCSLTLLAAKFAASPATSQRLACEKALQQIGQALANYRELAKSFPPVRTLNGRGTPVSSWRTSILPYVESPRMPPWSVNERSWNDPWNRHTAAVWKDHFFLCPAGRGNTVSETAYLAVTDASGQWLTANGRCTNPVLVVETRNSGIDWMEPRDTALDEVCRHARTAKPILSSKHLSHDGHFIVGELGAHAFFADGSVHWIPAELPIDILRAALQGDPAAQRKMDEYSIIQCHLNWPNCLALAALIACTATMLFWPKVVQFDGKCPGEAQPPAREVRNA
jgi:hypothetical protein